MCLLVLHIPQTTHFRTITQVQLLLLSQKFVPLVILSYCITITIMIKNDRVPCFILFYTVIMLKSVGWCG